MLHKLCVAEAIMFSLCPIYQMSVPLSTCPKPTSAYFLLRMNSEHISMKFAGDNDYHQPIN